MFDALILGAGFVGLGTALALQERGLSVAILDHHTQAARETSFGNAGIVQGESVYPHTFPRNIAEIARASLNWDPRVQIRYAALPAIAYPLWRYFLAANPVEREHSGRALRALTQHAVAEHERLAQAAGAQDLLRSGGWIQVFRTQQGEAQGFAHAEETRAFGVRFERLDRAQLLALEPGLSEAAIGGLHFSATLSTPDPAALGQAYLALFLKRGGVFLQGDAMSLAQAGEAWQVGAVQARRAVIALGPWSDALARRFGYKAPFFVKRGYHQHYAQQGDTKVTRPIMDTERGYVVTPMSQGLRLTSGAEFARLTDPPSPAHLRRVEPFARAMFPLGDPVGPRWLGQRPCLPDMLPIISPAGRHKGLWFNYGHQHLGFTLGPIGGRLLAEMMTQTPCFVDPAPYAMSRFSGSPGEKRNRMGNV